jgi:CheY-like chemotaxis protein
MATTVPPAQVQWHGKLTLDTLQRMAEHQPNRLLVVDDDSATRELLELLLTREGYRVSTAESGEAALKMLEGGLRPDAILTDLQMPGITGRSLAAKARSLCGDEIPIFAMSGSETNRELLEGFSGFLRKPFGADKLHETLTSEKRLDETLLPPSSVPVLNPYTYQKLSSSMTREKLQQLYRLCLDDSQHRIGKLRQAAEQGDDAACRREAHAIKGGCRMVGAMELGALAEFIEDHGLVANLINRLDELQLACNRLESVLCECESATERTGP